MLLKQRSLVLALCLLSVTSSASKGGAFQTAPWSHSSVTSSANPIPLHRPARVVDGLVGKRSMSNGPGTGDGGKLEVAFDETLPSPPSPFVIATTASQRVFINFVWFGVFGACAVFWLNTNVSFHHVWVGIVLDVITFGTFLPLGVLAGIFSAVEALLVEERMIGIAISKAMGVMIDQEKDVQLGSDVKKLLLQLRETIIGEVFEGRGMKGGFGRLLIGFFSPFWDSLITRIETEIARVEMETSQSWNGDKDRLSRFLEIVANGAVSGMLGDRLAEIVGLVLFLMTTGEGLIVALDSLT